MEDGCDRTVEIQLGLDRLRLGDFSAIERLLAISTERLTRIAAKMLKDFPGVGRWEQSDDVAQNVVIRLDRALRSVTPATPRDFFRLAAAQVRRELIDLARHYYGPQGMGAHHATQAPCQGSAAADLARSPIQSTYDPSRLAAWAEFHAAVESLSDSDRELFDLLWYEGLTQAEAAAMLGISERTVHSRWLAARVRLSDTLGGQLPV